MDRLAQNIGMGLTSFLNDKHISVEEAAQKIEYSFRDLRRLIEGRLFVSPKEWGRISEKLGVSLDYLVSYQPDNGCRLPDLEYNKEFSDYENLYTVIDLLDEYIELKEQV